MDFEKDYLDEKEPLDVEEDFEKPELTKGTTRDTDPQYFTNINGIYAKDAAGRAAVEELRTLVTGYSETVLYTASSPHTNNIEFSQAYTNFDDIVVVWAYSVSSGGEYHNRFQQAFKTSALVADDNILVGEVTSGGDFTAYTVVDTTHINFTEKAGTYYNWISKVIGINYGSNGGAVANPVRSLAKSEEKEKPIEEEEPTDEMR